MIEWAPTVVGCRCDASEWSRAEAVFGSIESGRIEPATNGEGNYRYSPGPGDSMGTRSAVPMPSLLVVLRESEPATMRQRLLALKLMAVGMLTCPNLGGWAH
jgi:hypothetical protein